MSNIISVGNQSFIIQDYGGGGACLFKCLSVVSKVDNRLTRRQIVNYVVSNWNFYSVLVYNVLKIKKKCDYGTTMRNYTTYGTEVEVRAACNLYNLRILLIRKLEDEYFFEVEFLPEGFNDGPLELECFYLFYTGNYLGNDDSGHYQVLQEINAIQNPVIESIIEDAEIFNESYLDMDTLNRFINSSEFSNDENQNENSATYSNISTSSSSSNNFENNQSTITTRVTKNKKKIKNRVRNTYRKCCKQLIFNSRNYFKHNKRQLNISNIYIETAKCLKVSKTSVYNIFKEACFNNDKVLGTSYFNSGRKKLILEEFFQAIIRRKILDFYKDKKYPSVNELREKLLKDVTDFPPISNFIFRNALRSMNFKFKKFKKKPTLMESTAVAASRAAYLRKIRSYRMQNYPIFYLDETWCGANHTKKYGWIEEVDPSEFNNYDHYRRNVQQVYGERGGFITPTGPGKRVIILHISNEHGFLNGAMDCFVGKTGCDDYHHEMNAAHFSEWFSNMLLLLPPNAVVVLDQAPYHTMIDPDYRNPTTQWRKGDILDWFERRNVPLPEDITSFSELTKVELLNLSKEFRYEKVYLLDKIRKNLRDDVKLLWLPVAHCEFNPIELIWAYVKNKVAKQNNTYNVNDVHKLCIDIMNDLPANLWANCLKHAIKYEDFFKTYTT